MVELSTALLALLTPKIRRKENPPSISRYHEAITSNAATLDSIAQRTVPKTQTQRASLVCKASEIVLGRETVVSKNDASYQEKSQPWYTLTKSMLRTCFIKPKNTLEVRIALKIIASLQSKFAVRTVGHNANPGFSSVNESGVVIDLRELRSVALAPERDVVSVGPGAMCGEVYDMLEKDELTVVGGRVSEVGVGGLLLGGGMSHFSNRWGMACDNGKNFENFEVVLANSEVVNANEHENQGFFRSLKGGGPNFGIVTRFDLYTYPDYKVWYTFKMYSANDIERVMRAAIDVQKAMEVDDRIGFFLTCTGNSFVAGMLHLGWTDSPVSAFKAFDEIAPISVTVPETNGTASSVAAAVSMNEPAKRESGTLTVLPDVDLYVELQDILQKNQSSATTSESYSLVFTYQPVAKASVKEGNSLIVSPVSQAWLAIAITWIEASEDELARKQIRELISGIENAAQARGLLSDFKFMNDASYIHSHCEAMVMRVWHCLTQLGRAGMPKVSSKDFKMEVSCSPGHDFAAHGSSDFTPCQKSKLESFYSQLIELGRHDTPTTSQLRTTFFGAKLKSETLRNQISRSKLLALVQSWETMHNLLIGARA